MPASSQTTGGQLATRRRACSSDSDDDAQRAASQAVWSVSATHLIIRVSVDDKEVLAAVRRMYTLAQEELEVFKILRVRVAENVHDEDVWPPRFAIQTKGLQTASVRLPRARQKRQRNHDNRKSRSHRAGEGA